MKVKRVVTVVDENGRSSYQEDAPIAVTELEALAGWGLWLVWGTEGRLEVPAPEGVTGMTKPFFPGPGGTRFGVFSIPPQERDAPSSGAPDEETMNLLLADAEEKVPGMLGHFDPENPGMHATQTVDYDIVLQGTVTLELDDGAEVELPPGSCVVQNGARHGWRNYGTETAIMAYVLVGAS